MMHSTIKILVTLVVLVCFCPVAMGQEITLHKKGTVLRLKKDLHCMDNATAQTVTEKLRLCPLECESKLEEAQNMCSINTGLLRDRLNIQKDKYLGIISVKDNTIESLQSASFDEISKLEGSVWWKVTLGALSGLVAGAGATFLIMKYTQAGE